MNLDDDDNFRAIFMMTRAMLEIRNEASAEAVRASTVRPAEGETAGPLVTDREGG